MIGLTCPKPVFANLSYSRANVSGGSPGRENRTPGSVGGRVGDCSAYRPSPTGLQGFPLSAKAEGRSQITNAPLHSPSIDLQAEGLNLCYLPRPKELPDFQSLSGP